MAQHDHNRYVQGYSDNTTCTQQKRTAETEAAFLLPHIKKTDYILDVGCGPGTVTTGLARLASQGTTIGIDISAAVLDKAKTLAAANPDADPDAPPLPATGPGFLTFEQGDILGRLAYADATSDVVFASHVFGHLRAPDEALGALAEMRRVLKPGGVLATRDAGAQHFYPSSCDLDRLWVGNLQRADTTSRLDAGIGEEEIEETLAAVQRWVETEDAWFVSLQCEMLAWK